MFSRWMSGPGGTLACRLFMKHHQEINALYWSHMLAARRTLTAVKKADRRMRPSALFAASPKYAKRAPQTLEQWEKEYKDFNNWVRLSAAVAVNSYMEIYLRSVSMLAIESDPGVIIGAPGAIDGVSLLKTRPGYGFPEAAVHFTKGDWNTRIAHYERLFGEAPKKLKACAKELNELRRLRNGVGHAFGRSLDEYESAALLVEPKPMMRLSEDRFAGWLRMAEEVAQAIDAHLRDKHIGQYERLLFYHRWLSTPEGRRAPEDASALQRAFLEEWGEVIDLAVLRGLIAWYRDC